jgi:hypothetical protein
MHIYWGAVPFVVIQMIMVAIVIAFPQMVTAGLDKTVEVDLDSVKVETQMDGYGAPPVIGTDGKTEEVDPNKAFLDQMKKDSEAEAAKK